MIYTKKSYYFQLEIYIEINVEAATLQIGENVQISGKIFSNFEKNWIEKVIFLLSMYPSQ